MAAPPPEPPRRPAAPEGGRARNAAALWALLGLALVLAATVGAGEAGVGGALEPAAGVVDSPEPAAGLASAPVRGRPLEADFEARRALAGGRRPKPVRPRPADVRRARAFARAQDGLVAFAVIDSRRRIHGIRARALFPTASVVKAPIMVARLSALEAGGERLEAAERDRLTAMIRWSDNDAADAVYGAVGDAALIETARRAGMRDFTIAGHWGNAQLSAADGARFMARLPRATPSRHRRFAMRLLATIVPEQRWGIPEAAPGWRIWFKGGWTPTMRGELVNQAALLERDGRRVALAILTDAQASHERGRAVLLGIAERLLAESPAGRRSGP